MYPWVMAKWGAEEHVRDLLEQARREGLVQEARAAARAARPGRRRERLGIRGLADRARLLVTAVVTRSRRPERQPRVPVMRAPAESGRLPESPAMGRSSCRPGLRAAAADSEKLWPPMFEAVGGGWVPGVGDAGEGAGRAGAAQRAPARLVS